MVAVGTFNTENLFARYRFGSGVAPAAADGFTVEQLAFSIYNETAKAITAKAIRAADADIWALQEIESLPVLDKFNSEYLGAAADRKFTNRVLIDGNDPRKIDVAVMTKRRFDVTRARTHRDERRRDGGRLTGVKVFGRDCLEVDVEWTGEDGNLKRLTLFVNHFKSMMGGRDKTRDRRVEQVERTLEIVGRRFPGFQGDFLVLGDLNDYPEADDDGTETALGALDDVLVDTIRQKHGDGGGDGIAPGWTHYWNRGDKYKQLDYIYTSTDLWDRAGDDATVRIERSGLPWRAERVGADRLDGVGEDGPKASDHCPVVIDIPDAALNNAA